VVICIGAAIGAKRHERDAGLMHQSVIAAVDPLREDIAPAALGLMLARLTRAPLLLAGAYPVDRHVDSIYPELTRAFRVDADDAMRRFGALVEQAPGPRVSVTTTVAASAGFPARALHDLAERQDASLLVLGSSRRGLVGRVLPSAVTDRLLHGAPCPVAVAPGGFSFEDAADGPRLIGVAFTETPGGHAALARGCTLASRARGLVRVLTVSEPLDPLLTSMLEAVAGEYVRGAHEDAAAAVLRRGLDRVSAGRSAGGEVLTGHPADALAAASHDLDLLVCGSRGYGPVRTLLLGGTSHALVRKAACPVLVVPPGSPAHTTTLPRSDEHALAG
jgi:nucleotide-binding universal stress UspA family protein